jgi:hypothetical protein
MQTARFFGSVRSTIRNDDASDELADGAVTSRGPHADARLCEPTREAAMAAFAK